MVQPDRQGGSSGDLEIAWQRVARNQGAAGVDGQSIERFEAQSERYLRELQRSLTEGRYQPDPVKRVEIPKGDGKTRPLGIPTVKDRIVQTALKMVSSRSLKFSSDRGVLGSGRDGAARMRCGKSIAC